MATTGMAVCASFIMLAGADQERFCKGIKEDVNDSPYTPGTYRGYR